MKESVRIDAPKENGGSENILGIEYQHHVIARRCIEMLTNRNTRKIMCEFYQDMALVDYDGKYEFIQIKKSLKNSWKLTDLISGKGGGKSILAKLFDIIPDRVVDKVSFLSHGRPGPRLYEFMHLLEIKKEERDSDWDLKMNYYEESIHEYLSNQGISRETVAKGVRILDIDLSLPSPDAIEACNRELLESRISEIWQNNVNLEKKRLAYNEITDKVREASKKPKKLRLDKTITRDEIINIVKSAIRDSQRSGNIKEHTNMRMKIVEKAKLWDEHYHYGLDKRSDAMFTKHELELDDGKWIDYQNQIYERWSKLCETSPELEGTMLWQSMKSMCEELGEVWKQEIPSLNCDFAEGILFFLTATCPAEWGS
jgi:hypothetical protein